MIGVGRVATTQADVTVPLGVIAVMVLSLSVIYSVRIAYTVLQGYRTAESSRVLYLALGLFLLTTVPILLRFVLATVAGLPAYAISGVTGLSELAGLGLILYVIYVPARKEERQRPRRSGSDSDTQRGDSE